MQHVDDAEMDPPHLVGVIVQQRHHPIGGTGRHGHLFLEFAPRRGFISSAEECDVLLVDVPADADRNVRHQPFLPALLPARITPEPALMDNEKIGNDLLVRRVPLRFAAPEKPMQTGILDQRTIPVEIEGQALKETCRLEMPTLDHQDPFVLFGHVHSSSPTTSV